MYGKGLGVVNTATGISMLPATGNNHLLFVLAASLMTTGVVIFAISYVLGRKGQKSEAK